jgi:heme exporter protein D
MLFVYAAYGVTIVGTLALVAQSWLAMKAAEARRDKARDK